MKIHRHCLLTAVIFTAGVSLGYADASLTLPAAVDVVKQMMSQGKSKQEIADWINQTVDNRLIALNQHTEDEKESLSETQYAIRKRTFDAWSQFGVEGGADNPFSAAHWVWQNGYGHCQEHAHTVFHILMMAQEDGSNICELVCGNHAYVVWGMPKGYNNMKPTISDINKWNDAFLIDPWQGSVVPAKDLGRTDWTLTKGGWKDIERLAAYGWKPYKNLYDKWLSDCDELAGSYGLESEKLVVTEVRGNSNIQVGQTQKIRPQGCFKVETLEGCTIKVNFKATVIEGQLFGTIANLFDVKSGAITNIKLTRIREGTTIKLKVTLVAHSPQTNSTIVREGVLSKI